MSTSIHFFDTGITKLSIKHIMGGEPKIVDAVVRVTFSTSNNESLLIKTDSGYELIGISSIKPPYPDVDLYDCGYSPVYYSNLTQFFNEFIEIEK